MQLKHHISGLFMLLALQAPAIEFTSTSSYTVAADETVSEELWVTAGTSQTEGTFESDLFILSGNNLQLNGTYKGNVWGLGSNNTEMGGRCERSLRLAGKTIAVKGSVNGNIMAIGDTVILAPDAIVGGDLKLLGNSIVVEGRTAGNVSITSTRLVTLGGTIDGDVKVTAPDILFSRGARILGNLTYTAGKEIIPGEGIVAGKLDRIIPEAPALFSRARLASHLMWFIAAIIAGVPFIILFPLTTAMASQLAKTKPWKCLLVGLVACGALPIFGFACVSSIIGVPIGALILASWGALFYISRIIIGLMIGTLLLRPGTGASVGRIVSSMVLGVALIYFATFFPSIGFTVQLAVAWLGMGALLLALLQKRRLIIQVPQELKQIEELKHQNQSKEQEGT